MEKKSEELVSRLSYEVVKEVAPDELDLFDDIKEVFLKNPDAFSEKDPKKREEMLGFALPAGTEQFITGVVLPAAWNIIKKYVSKKVGERLSINEIKELRDDAYNIAISQKVDKKKAALIADSLAGKLVQLVSK